MRSFPITAMVCVLALAGCKGHTDNTERVVPVSVIEVGEAEESFTKSYNGNVGSARIQVMLAPHSGSVTSIKAKVGQFVPDDGLLLHIDSPDVKSLHDANQATLLQARDGYARAKKLHDGGGLSELKWMDVQTKLAQAEASAEISDRSLEKCNVRAPFSGTVSEVLVTLGQQITMGQPMLTIMDESHLEVKIDIPENEYSLVKANSAAEVVIPALDNIRVKGKVSDMAIHSNSMTHSYEAMVVLDKKPKGLMSGMICKVYLRSNSEDHLVIPADIVKIDENGSYVWVVDSLGIVSKRHIDTGKFLDKGVAVKGGLNTGDQVIVEGSSKVSTGMKVNAKIVDNE